MTTTSGPRTFEPCRPYRDPTELSRNTSPYVRPMPQQPYVVEAVGATIRGAADGYLRFSTQAGVAVERLDATTVASWEGDEGDTFRANRARFRPTPAEAQVSFRTVASAIEEVAAAADEARRRMDACRVQARAAWDLMEQRRLAWLRSCPLTDTPFAGTVASSLTPDPGLIEAERAYLACEDEAARVTVALRAAADRAARTIRAQPGPTALTMDRRTPADVDPAAPPTVVRRYTIDASVSAVVTNILGGKGLVVVCEELSNGRTRIRLLRAEAVGAEAGVGAGQTFTVGKTKVGLAAEASAEARATALEGTVLDVPSDAVVQSLLAFVNPFGGAARSRVRSGRYFGGVVEAKAEASVTVGTGVVQGEAGLKETVQGEVYTDGELQVTLTAEGKAEAKASLEMYDEAQEAMKDTMHLPDTEAGLAAAGLYAVTFRRRPDGSGSITLTSRKPLDDEDADGNDQTEVREITRVVSEEESAAIADAASRGDVEEVSRRVKEITGDIVASHGVPDENVTDHTYVYSSDEQKLEGDTTVAAGEEVEVTASGVYTQEQLTSVDGKPVQH